MADVIKLQKNLEKLGYRTRYFHTAAEAADYLDSSIRNTTVAFGGSMTLKQLGLHERLAAQNQVIWHWQDAQPADALGTKVYLCSVNGAAETGELVNIDGTCNRVSGTLFGHEKVYFVMGVNKIAPDYDGALWRVRNVAAPLNARRLNKNTPCAEGEMKCHNCSSPERICRALTVLWAAPKGAEYEVVIVGEELGL